jgi:hypothetical protein
MRHRSGITAEEAVATMVSRSQQCLSGVSASNGNFSDALNHSIHRSLAWRTADQDQGTISFAQDQIIFAGPVVLVLNERGKSVSLVLAEEEEHIRQSGVIVVLGDNNGLTNTEQESVEAVASTRRARVREVSLGPVPLLASHCIVLMHHYLDQLHVCAPMAGIGRTLEAQSRSDMRAATFAETT